MGSGKELNIWYFERGEDSINSDKIRAYNTQEIALHCFESQREAGTPKVIMSLSDISKDDSQEYHRSRSEIQPISDDNDCSD